MLKRSYLWLVTLGCILFIGCAFITVNVYFPEKDLNKAYSTLEDELMKTGPKKDAPAPAPDKKSSMLPFQFNLVPVAYAQEDMRKTDETGLSADLVAKIKGNPEVVQAYRNMGDRLDDINRLRDAGTVGEGTTGLLIPRVDVDAIDKKDMKKIRDENADRTTIMKGMAQAMLEVRALPNTDENRKTTLKQATEQFAKLRVDKANSGWWIQAADGKWNQKK
jgi:hypothetical protein